MSRAVTYTLEKRLWQPYESFVGINIFLDGDWNAFDAFNRK
jgi:hypothetical protein